MSASKFKAHRRVVFNKYLPYSDQLDNEAVEYLKRIKVNLSNALIRVDCEAIDWILDLESLLQVYGYFFDKDDHIYFVNVLFKLIYTPNLSLHFTKKNINLLCKLLL